MPFPPFPWRWHQGQYDDRMGEGPRLLDDDGNLVLSSWGSEWHGIQVLGASPDGLDGLVDEGANQAILNLIERAVNAYGIPRQLKQEQMDQAGVSTTSAWDS